MGSLGQKWAKRVSNATFTLQTWGTMWIKNSFQDMYHWQWSERSWRSSGKKFQNYLPYFPNKPAIFKWWFVIWTGENVREKHRRGLLTLFRSKAQILLKKWVEKNSVQRISFLSLFTLTLGNHLFFNWGACHHHFWVVYIKKGENQN